MPLVLRPYQTMMFDDMRAHLRAGVKSILATTATGAGKTVLAAHMISSAVGKGKRAWFTVHRQELLRQSVETLAESANLNVGVIAAGWGANGYHAAQVATIQTLMRRWQKYAVPDLLVVDECFPVGTMIDGTPIESIVVGDVVKSWDGTLRRLVLSRVTRLMNRTAPIRLLRVSCAGQSVVCTEHHPFLNANGHWVDANQLKEGDWIHVVRNVPSASAGTTLPVLLPEDDGRTEPTNGSRTNAGPQSDAERGNASKDVSDIAPDRAQAEDPWRQWKAIACASDGIAGIINRMAGRVRSIYQWWSQVWLSHKLQTRFSLSVTAARYRSRRRLTLSIETPRGRQEEGALLKVARVDRVEIFQQGSDGGFERLCPDGRVYNIEVERTHSYVANGFVVHNCHHVASKSWSELVKALRAKNPSLVVIGLTATPTRLDGRGLGEHFEVIVEGPSTARLISEKYLAPYRLFAPSTVDLSKVHIVAGDYNKHELDDAMRGSRVVGDAVKEYKDKCNGKRALMFLWSIRASEQMAEALNAAGIPAVHIDGMTDDPARAKAVRDFRDGRIKVMTNVEIVTEGFDLPAIEACFLLRPTQSLGLYLQMVGRSLRTFPGKEYALIFDHAGLVFKHGLPDDQREWSLEGIDKSATKKQEVQIRQCGRCYAVMPAQARKCIECGFEFPVQYRKVEQEDGELKEVDPAMIRARLKREQASARDYDALVLIERQRGYKPGWARHILEARQRRELTRTSA